MSVIDKPLLIMKTGHTLAPIAARRGDFEQWIINTMGLDESGVVVVNVAAGEMLPEVSEVAGMVITGAPAMVTENLPWINMAEKFVIDAVNCSVPTLGICFGHQLMAQALGGEVGWHPEGREIGTTTVSLTSQAQEDALFGRVAGKIPVHVTHMQSVIKAPPGSIILAGNSFEAHHGVRFAPAAWGLQFHPEFDEDIMTGYLKERIDDLVAEGLDPDALLAAVRPTPEAAGLLKRFAALCAVKA